jgi:hypothetical protein
MIAIQQTVEIPANGWVHLDIPPEWAGASGNVVVTALFPAVDETKIKFSAARQKLRELCKDSKLTVDSFLAMKHADRVLEAAIDKRLSEERKS